MWILHSQLHTFKMGNRSRAVHKSPASLERSNEATDVLDSVQPGCLAVRLSSSHWWPLLISNQVSDLHLYHLSGVRPSSGTWALILCHWPWVALSTKPRSQSLKSGCQPRAGHRAERVPHALAFRSHDITRIMLRQSLFFSEKKNWDFYCNCMGITFINLIDLTSLWYWIFQLINMIYLSIYLDLVSIVLSFFSVCWTSFFFIEV